MTFNDVFQETFDRKAGMMSDRKHLVLLGCSASKRDSGSQLPAISLYDGPAFRVLRAYLRDYRWPKQLSVAVLSARYGVIGGLSRISTYDQRMTRTRAAELAPKVNQALSRWQMGHSQMDLILGQDYLHAIDQSQLGEGTVRVVDGPIGVKLNRLHSLLRSLGGEPRKMTGEPANPERPLYFLPDWDDFLDVNYDFQTDTFSAIERSRREEKHSIALMQPHRICDGILVSLAQNLGGKGLLKRVGFLDEQSLAPTPVREHFRLLPSQWAFGDCGAFSYVAEEKPTISVEQAVSLYDLHEFDLGASVDHIPVAEVVTDAGKRVLSPDERRDRIRLTRDNAEQFLAVHREMRARFIPVGVIQGIEPEDYARQLGEYAEMGYRYVALGGLVPRSDAGICVVIDAVTAVRNRLLCPPWIHLLGVFRPQLQSHFRRLGIESFDSTTYFRKAWLRSDQNYLGVDGNWYAAIRVPPLSDPRMRQRMDTSCNIERRQRLEADALRALRAYDAGTLDIEAALAAILEYDRLLGREETKKFSLAGKYRRTLEARPWRQCNCPVCRQLGIEVVIFRGLNRNKRRGAHNTLQLFKQIQQGGS